MIGSRGEPLARCNWKGLNAGLPFEVKTVEWNFVVWQHLRAMRALSNGDTVYLEEVMGNSKKVCLVVACLEFAPL